MKYDVGKIEELADMLYKYVGDLYSLRSRCIAGQEDNQTVGEYEQALKIKEVLSDV